MPAIPNIPLGFTAALVAAAVLVAVCTQAAKPLLAAARKPRPGSSWDRPLLAIVIVLGCGLAPVFFLDMFRTVTDLLASSVTYAWTVPAATEGAFLFLYLLGLWLQRKGKPQAWLRWAPYPFAAASLFLNVWAAHGNFPAMVGHASVTIAFFLPVLAAESAIHSMAVTEEDMAMRRELADARRYALDFVRDQKGIWWRLRVPSLLKRQILHSRPPAAVQMAVAEGAEGKGAAAWEKPVEDWVVHGLTRREDVAAKVTRKRAEIARGPLPEAAAAAAPEVSAEAVPEAPVRDTPDRVSRGARTALQEVGRIAKRAGARKVPRELLLEAIGEMYSGDTPPSAYRVEKELPVGEKTARELLAEVTAKGADVIQMAAR